MGAPSSMEQLGKGFKVLMDESTKKIVLTGEPGVGKTWMARMLSDRAIKAHKFDVVLWVFLSRRYDRRAFYETIAHQLSLISAPNDCEFEDQPKSTESNEKDNLDNEATKEPKNTQGKEKDNEKKAAEELQNKVVEELKEQRVLLILDEEVDHKDSGANFDLIDELKRLEPQKILITRCETTKEDEHPDTYTIEVGPLSEKGSSSLMDDEIKFPENTTAQTLLKKIRPLPADIKVLAKAFKHLREPELETAKEVALLHGDGTYNAMQLLLNGYELLPRSVLLDWYQAGNHFLQHGKTLHYRELIVYWILEGYLGHFDSIDDAYKKGHSVLMELLDCGLLKEQSGGDVVLLDCWLPEEQSYGDAKGKNSKRQRLTLDPYVLCEFIQTIPLGLANVSGDNFQRILGPNGMIKMLSNDEGNKKASVLLVDANHLSREIPDNFYLSVKEVEVLAIFNPTDKSLPLPLFQMHNRRLLVLRGCEFLESINKTPENQTKLHPSHSIADPPREDALEVTQAPDANNNAIPKTQPSSSSPTPSDALPKLTILEISGSFYLKEIPDDLFRSAPNLQSLNLSFLPIEKLPPSFYRLQKLVWLILRGCSCLEMLGNLKEFHNLQMLDLSGATSFSGFKDRSFGSNKELQTLNLSQSGVKKLPLLCDLTKLNHLLLKDCSQLSRLPKISALTSLEILDVSGSTSFKEFHDPSIADLKLLKLINISRTAVKKLPLHLSNPRCLCLSGCSKLTRLSFIESMKDLEILDLSDCTSLKEIREKFFEDLTSLQVLNLSGTQVKTLPSFSKLSNLRLLLLFNCTSLEELGELNTLEKLETLDLSNSQALTKLESFRGLNNLKKLDLSGTQVTCLPELPDSSNLCDLFLKNCTNFKQLPESSRVLVKLGTLNLSGASALDEIQVNFLKGMTNLRNLDLSETKIRILPSLSDLKSLSHLLLKNCQNLTEVPDLEKLTSLEKLDLSGTAVKKLPEFEQFSHLRCLLLKDCSNLENFSQVDILGHLTDPDKELPCKISQLAELEVLELPKANIETADLQEIKSPADKQIYQWSISWQAARSSSTAKLSMSTNCIPFLHLLKKNRSLHRSLSQIHLYVHPVEAETRFGDKFCNELFLRDTYIRTRKLPQKEQGSLDIRGFDYYPKGLELILPHASNVFLVSNMFLRCLTDLRAQNIMKMEVCWIERCENMKTVLSVDKVENTAAMGNDTEGESEVRKNEEDNADINGHSRSLQSNMFDNLRCLYLEHCPTLSYICHSSQQLKYLEVLQIKNCKELEVLFKDEPANLPKLQKLKLWELPKLEKITCEMPSLSTLVVGECPQLRNILSSAPLPEDPVLKVLEIRSCDKLKNVFKGSKMNLRNLCKLHLWDLPELQSIGAYLPQLDRTNPEIDYTIRGCPHLWDLPEL